MSNENESILDKIDDRAHDFETERVPEGVTRPWYELAFIWAGLQTAALGLLFGAFFVGSGLPFSTIFTFLLVGNVIIVVFYTIVGSTGVIERVSAPYVAQRIFGRVGTLMYSVFLGILIMGWGAVMLQLMGQGMNQWFGVFSLNVWYLIVAIIIATTTLVGYKALSALSSIIVPIFALTIPAVGVKAIQTVGWSNMWGTPREFGVEFTLLSGITFTVGLIALGASQCQAVTRYAEKTSDITIASTLSIFWGHFGFFIAGAGIAAYAQTADLFQLFGVLGPVGVFLFFATLWTTADNDFYYAGLAFSRVYEGIPKWIWTSIAMFVGLVYIWADILALIEQWIELLGVYMPPVIGLLAVDYYLLPKLNIERPSCMNVERKINIAGITSWIAASALLYTDTLLTTVVPVDAVLYGGAIYLVLGYIQFKFTPASSELNEPAAAGGD